MTQKLLTSGDIARRLGQRFNRVQYIIKTRLQIRPIGRVGICWLYDESAVDVVRSEIENIEANRQAVSDG